MKMVTDNTRKKGTMTRAQGERLAVSTSSVEVLRSLTKHANKHVVRKAERKLEKLEAGSAYGVGS